MLRLHALQQSKPVHDVMFSLSMVEHDAFRIMLSVLI